MPTGACAKRIWEPMSSLLEVKSLSVRYGRVHAVRDIYLGKHGGA